MQTETKPQRKKLLRHMTPCLEGFKAVTWLTPPAMALEVLMEVFIPLLMAVIVDGGLYREENFILKDFFPAELIANETKFVLTVGLAMVIASLLSLLFGVVAARLSAESAMGFARNLRAVLLDKIESFSFSNIDRFSSSSLVMRSTSDVTNLQTTFQQLIRMMVRSPMMMILASVMAISINPRLAMIFLFAIPLLAAAMLLLMRAARQRFKLFLKKYDKMNTDVQENLIAVRVVKSFVRGSYEKKRFADSATELRRSQIAVEKLFTAVGPLQMLIMWTCTIILLVTGTKEIVFQTTGLHAGELVSLVTYTSQVINSLAMISFMIVSLSRTQASLDRINEVLDEEPDIKDGEGTFSVEDGSIEFIDLDFSYTGKADKLQLRQINLKINSGETVGVIGGTGEGKTTLVSLIPRFYDATAGELLVGGHSVKDYPVKVLRDSVSAVLQNGSLFSGTIEDNLRWGNSDASEDEIRAACEACCADDFIKGFPDGYKTELGQGGVNLSGGQKQRLRIARALLKKPKILILDDSTSAVDTATDEKIRRTLREAHAGATKIIIAQRIASVMDADKIIVMDKGCVSAVGKHAELMESSEIYREVFESQMKGGEELA